MVFILIFLVAFSIGQLIRVLTAVYAPKAHEVLHGDQERRRARRNTAVKTGLGLAFRFLGK